LNVIHSLFQVLEMSLAILMMRLLIGFYVVQLI